MEPTAGHTGGALGHCLVKSMGIDDSGSYNMETQHRLRRYNGHTLERAALKCAILWVLVYSQCNYHSNLTFNISLHSHLPSPQQPQYAFCTRGFTSSNRFT